MASMDIMGLKNDILFEFFALIAATDPPHAETWVDPGPLKYHLGWVRLTHVCRLWRTLLIDEMPSLWARAVCLLPPARDTMLSRAQDLPLSLTTDVSKPGSWLNLPGEHTLFARLREFPPMHITRARALNARGVGMDWVSHLAGKHLPLLEKITVHQEQPQGDQTPVATLFPFDAPNLRSAKLYGIAATFTSQSIRQLVLTGRGIFSHADWHILDVLKSLSSSLEYLELEMRPPEPVNWRAQAPAPFPLERLKHLHLYGTENANVPELVRLLDVPTLLEEHTYYVNIDPKGWERFANTLGPALHQSPLNALFFTDDGQIVASTFAAAERPEGYPGSVGQEVTLEAEHGRDHELAKKIATALLAHLDRTHIEQIVFGYDVPDEKVDDSRDTLRPFEAVTSFAALSHDSLKVLRINDSSPEPIFPNLSLLVANMEPRYDSKKWEAESLRAWWDMLCGVMEDRTRVGVPIPRLRLSSIATGVDLTDAMREVEAEGLARVKELVPEFEDTRWKAFEAAKE